jgi:hypothetical protein
MQSRLLNMKVRKAVIPAAGFGTQMLPITSIVPKELLPVCGRPVIEHVVREAADAGIEEVILVINEGKEAVFAPVGFSWFFISCFKSACIIPIVLHRFSWSIKNHENFDAKQFLEPTLKKMPTCSTSVIKEWCLPLMRWSIVMM